MKNVDKSSVQGIETICQGLAKQLTVLTMGAAMFLAPLGSTTAKADGAPVTQFQFLQWVAQVSGNTGQFNASSTAADYVHWAQSTGLNPGGGWQPGANLTKKDLIALTVQIMNLNPNKFNGDLARILAREGIDLSGVSDQVTKDDVTSLMDKIQPRLAPQKGPSTPAAPSHGNSPRPKVSIICQNGHTIVVSSAAIDAHLRNGATLGPCHSTLTTNP
jgi:hypothetical protein